MKRISKLAFVFLSVAFAMLVLACPPGNNPEPTPSTNDKVTGVTLDKKTLTLEVGETAKLTATVTPSNVTNKEVSWKSDNGTVATVSNDGTVTALKVGNATITVTTNEGNFKATCKVIVTQKPSAQKVAGTDFVQISTGSMSLDTDGSYYVTLTKAYQICDHEVTQAEWQSVMGNNPSEFQGDGETVKVATGENQNNRPVEQVSWYDAIAYCNKRSINESLEPCYAVTGITDWGSLNYSDIPTDTDSAWDNATCDFSKNGYRLPTEAEWEIAARGGVVGDVYAGTNDVNELGNYAWWSDNSNGRTHEVKKKSPNAYGLYDMSGNVWELCWDWFDSYDTTNPIDPKGPDSGQWHILRGGCYSDNANDNYNSRVAIRNNRWPYDRFIEMGFRIARTVQ